jgi:hypothetical protein
VVPDEPSEAEDPHERMQRLAREQREHAARMRWLAAGQRRRQRALRAEADELQARLVDGDPPRLDEVVPLGDPDDLLDVRLRPEPVPDAPADDDDAA